MQEILRDRQVCLDQAQTDVRGAAGTVLAFKEAVRTAAGACGGRLDVAAALVVPE